MFKNLNTPFRQNGALHLSFANLPVLCVTNVAISGETK